MPEYFRHFPQVKHSGRDVTDITKRVAFFDRVATDPRVFLPYTVEEGMRAEDVAYYYYDDPGFVWLIYLANNIVDPYLEWPLTQVNLEGHIEEKYLYSCAECAINTTSVFDEVKTKFLLLIDARNKKHLTSEVALYDSSYEEVWNYIDININDTYLQGLLTAYYEAIDDANISYDIKTITDEELEKVKGTKILVVGALRRENHLSHMTIDEAIALSQKINPEITYFTHMSHVLGRHEEVIQTLPPNITLAYDGLELEL